MATIFFIIGIFGILNAGIFIGVFTTGQQQRANYHTETKEDHRLRMKVGKICGIIGVISLLIGMLFYLIF
jgi:O-antigen/teichoic acid export membrane protein